MIRTLITILVPLLAPFVLYAVYARLTRRANPEAVLQTPWYWLVAVGLGLTITTLIVTATLTGSDPSGTYIPPRMEDGRIVPSEVR